MGKAVTRGQALELVGQFGRDINWDALTSGNVQAIIDLSPEERTARFTTWLQNGACLIVKSDETHACTDLPKFAKWRTFLIGGVAKEVLLKRVEAGFVVSDYAKSLVNNPALTTLDKEEAIDTIILTPADFGYERMPTTTELLNPTRLAEWSAQNAERLDGHVVELLPAEAGPHIRDQYKDQPSDEVLWIAMERITDSDGDPGVFYVGRDSDGEQWLDADWTDPDDQWGLGRRLVFRLRKVTQD
ncbi:MAG: hypothetical protein JWN64_401 [Parcubacteria group bacterium]|nr:hypothetical protein [Parcubacteria group bacterium]